MFFIKASLIDYFLNPWLMNETLIKYSLSHTLSCNRFGELLIDYSHSVFSTSDALMKEWHVDWGVTHRSMRMTHWFNEWCVVHEWLINQWVPHWFSDQWVTRSSMRMTRWFNGWRIDPWVTCEYWVTHWFSNQWVTHSSMRMTRWSVSDALINEWLIAYSLSHTQLCKRFGKWEMTRDL